MKVHCVVSDRHGKIRTACGIEASLCRGWNPRPGSPGEYDTAICNRIEATPHAEDVTCKRCHPGPGLEGL